MSRTKDNSTRLFPKEAETESLCVTVPSFIVKSVIPTFKGELDWKKRLIENRMIRIEFVEKLESRKEGEND